MTFPPRQVVRDAKNSVRDAALMVIVSYDLATRMVGTNLLWKGQVGATAGERSLHVVAKTLGIDWLTAGILNSYFKA